MKSKYSYRAIFKGLKDLLSTKGICYMEIGYDLLEDIKNILKEFNFNLIKVHRDFQGHSRVLEINWLNDQLSYHL